MTRITQAVLFVVMVFGVSLTFTVILRPRTAPQGIWDVLAWLLPVVWAPTIIAVVLVTLTDGAAGMRKEVSSRLNYRRGSAQWLLGAAAVPLVAHALAVVCARVAGDSGPFISTAAIPIAVAVQLITGAVGEELGWRGFLLPRLATRFGETGAGWVMALLWSLWHVPAYFMPGMPHQTMPMFASLLSVVLFGVFLAFVFTRAGQSVLPTIVAHLALNVASSVGGVRLSSPVYWWVLDAVFGSVVVIGMLTPAARSRSRALLHHS